MNTYKVTNITTNEFRTNLSSRDVQLLLGISSSHVGFYAARGSLYKNKYKIVKIEEEDVSLKKMPPGFKEEWDKARFRLNPKARGL